jgi:hypothetical protein
MVSTVIVIKYEFRLISVLRKQDIICRVKHACLPSSLPLTTKHTPRSVCIRIIFSTFVLLSLILKIYLFYNKNNKKRICMIIYLSILYLKALFQKLRLHRRGGQLDQLREPHFSRKHSVRVMYSTLEFIKSKYRSVLTDEHLTELVRTALTTGRLSRIIEIKKQSRYTPWRCLGGEEV